MWWYIIWYEWSNLIKYDCEFYWLNVERKKECKKNKDDHTNIFLTDCDQMKLDYNTFTCKQIVHNTIVEINQLSDVIAFG